MVPINTRGRCRKWMTSGRNFLVANIEKDGIKFFQVMNGCVYEHKEMNDVLLTFHENPEKKGTYFKLYHFLINANLVEREESALQARNKNTKNNKK